MAEIVPFRALLYDPAKAGSLDRLLAPPYDVVSPAERERLAAKSPHNFVRVDLPEGEGAAKYQNAARELSRWLEQGVLRRDDRPALYRYHQRFTHGGREFTRRGVVGRVRLRRYEERVVLPHERTLSGPRLDRLELTRATRAHLSQVFALYSDPQRRVDAEFATLESAPPDLEGRTDDGTVHRVWRLTDPAAQGRVAAALADARLYIADGHHRYETMLAVRDELKKLSRSPRSSIEYGSMFVTSMEDPDLLVLPTHRVVHGLRGFELERFLARLGERFQVDELSGAPAGQIRDRLALAGRTSPAFAFLSGSRSFLAVLRPGQEAAVPGAAPVRTLDVAVLHALILEELLGIDREAQERQTNLRYVKDLKAAFDEAGRSEVQTVFLLNPTGVAQLRAVADAGEIMPQKSTYFFPKLASGLFLNPIDPAEEIPEGP
ncbi:MAG TPA: DUF1015 domain-containing protein [Myxococcales bacterium]|nr:DUF1015 domain-containing protein [Myxococcales bacterium]